MIFGAPLLHLVKALLFKHRVLTQFTSHHLRFVALAAHRQLKPYPLRMCKTF